jgi:hypothetical protein
LISRRTSFGSLSVLEKNWIKNKSISCKRTIVDKIAKPKISSRTQMYSHLHRKLLRMRNQKEEKENW